MDRPRRLPEPPAIDITWVSCRGVRSSLPFHTPCLYASVSVTSSSPSRKNGRSRPHRVSARTPTDRAGGENPEWEDERLRLHLPDDHDASEQEAADDGGVLVVRFELKAEVAVLGDVLAASAVVPLPDLVADGATRRVSYQLAAPSDGRLPNGVISFSYAFHHGTHRDESADAEPVTLTPPCPAPAAPLIVAPTSYGMYPMIDDDWPSMEQLAPLMMEQSAVYPPPLTAGTVTGSRYYHYHASTPPVQPAGIYPPLTTARGGIYPAVGEPDNGLYPTVDLAPPVSCYPPPTAPRYGRGFEYPAASDWDTRYLYG